MRRRTVVNALLVLVMALGLLTPTAAAADDGAGPFFLAVPASERYVRGGEVLQEADFGPEFQPRPGDQVFFNEALYHSTARGAKGTRAGRTTVHCLVGIRQQFFCDGTMILRDRGELYLTTSTPEGRRFLAAITGGTREFKSARGDAVLTNLPSGRTLYQLRLR